MGRGWYIGLELPGGKHVTLVHIDDVKWKGSEANLKAKVDRAYGKVKQRYKNPIVFPTNSVTYFGKDAVVQRITKDSYLQAMQKDLYDELKAENVPMSNLSAQEKFDPHVTLKKLSSPHGRYKQNTP